jgi:hypothetical protein
MSDDNCVSAQASGAEPASQSGFLHVSLVENGAEILIDNGLDFRSSGLHARHALNELKGLCSNDNLATARVLIEFVHKVVEADGNDYLRRREQELVDVEKDIGVFEHSINVHSSAECIMYNLMLRAKTTEVEAARQLFLHDNDRFRKEQTHAHNGREQSVCTKTK